MSLLEASRKMTQQAKELAWLIFPFVGTTNITDMEIPVSEDLLSYLLPEELLLYIMQFLEMNDLGRCARVCSNWKRLADDDSLWMVICRERWEGKHTQEQWLNHIKYQGEKFPSSTTWKQLYFEAETDSSRTKITEEELCNIKWDFRFHGVPNYMQHPVFCDDHTMVMNSRVMKWRFVEDEGETGPETFIQVDHYPFLSISRTDDWGWQLTNSYVTFNSQGKNPLDSSKKRKDRVNRWWFLLPLQIATMNDEEIEVVLNDLPEDLMLEEYEDTENDPEEEPDVPEEEPEMDNDNANDTELDDNTHHME